MKKSFPKRIVAIGSSSCEGKVDVEGGGFIGRLKKWRESLDDHNHVYNLGISGDTTSDILKRLVIEAKPRHPDLILIYHGLNDTRRENSKTAPVFNPLPQFKSNVKKLISQAQSLADVVIISVYPINEAKTTPLSWIPNYYLLADAKKYAQATKQICQDLNIPYVNVFDAWMKEDYRKYLHTDGLHPNSRGHQFFFKTIKKKLEELYN